jgi:hypothetical protein
MKEDFMDTELSEILGGQQLKWMWKGVKGHSRGLLMGIKEDKYEVEDYEVGNFYIGMVLRQRTTNFRWEHITVYGPTQHDKTIEFIAELSRTCMYDVLPIVLGGEFNVTISVKDKNNFNVDKGLIDIFNMFIDLNKLQEIGRSGPRYTLTNKQVNPTMMILDRILVSIDWESMFPMCFAWSKTRVGSDH